jgi:hypothetical protein
MAEHVCQRRCGSTGLAAQFCLLSGSVLLAFVCFGRQHPHDSYVEYASQHPHVRYDSYALLPWKPAGFFGSNLNKLKPILPTEINETKRMVRRTKEAVVPFGEDDRCVGVVAWLVGQPAG